MVFDLIALFVVGVMIFLVVGRSKFNIKYIGLKIFGCFIIIIFVFLFSVSFIIPGSINILDIEVIEQFDLMEMYDDIYVMCNSHEVSFKQSKVNTEGVHYEEIEKINIGYVFVVDINDTVSKIPMVYVCRPTVSILRSRIASHFVSEKYYVLVVPKDGIMYEKNIPNWLNNIENS